MFDIAPRARSRRRCETPRFIAPFPSPFTANSVGAVGVSALKSRTRRSRARAGVTAGVYASSRFVPQVAPPRDVTACPCPQNGSTVREIAAFPNGAYYSSPLTGAETRGDRVHRRSSRVRAPADAARADQLPGSRTRRGRAGDLRQPHVPRSARQRRRATPVRHLLRRRRDLRVRPGGAAAGDRRSSSAGARPGWCSTRTRATSPTSVKFGDNDIVGHRSRARQPDRIPRHSTHRLPEDDPAMNRRRRPPRVSAASWR